jgi:uncharacterized protein YdhG (YjbR/CyaY superfamily)
MTAPASVEAYLAGVPDPQRGALETLRAQVRAAAPDAVEVIAYGIPGLRLHGRYLLGYGVASHHCAFYPGKAPIQAHLGELEGFRILKGTIRFQPDHPIPADLVARLVRARVEERGPA